MDQNAKFSQFFIFYDNQFNWFFDYKDVFENFKVFLEKYFF